MRRASAFSTETEKLDSSTLLNIFEAKSNFLRGDKGGISFKLSREKIQIVTINQNWLRLKIYLESLPSSSSNISTMKFPNAIHTSSYLSTSNSFSFMFMHPRQDKAAQICWVERIFFDI